MDDTKKLIQNFVAKTRQAQKEAIENKTSKFLGWISAYVPEEIIMAAGFTPIRITGSASPISISKTYFSGNISSYVLSCLEGAVRGEYDFMEGVIIGGETDAMKRLYDTWVHFSDQNERKKFIGILDVPKFVTPHAGEHYKESILSLINEIETSFNINISTELLSKAIITCQKTRSLLDRLNNCRKKPISLISSVEILEICKLSVSGNKDLLNSDLSKLVQKLEQESNVVEPPSQAKPRLLMTGSFQDGIELLDVIEGSGGTLVCEDISNRIRYFRTAVKIGKNPIDDVVEGYLNKPPSASVADCQKRAEYILNLIKEFKIGGVIYHVLKFDDPYLFEFPDIREFLNKNSIPIVRIETEASRVSEGQVKTRLQAFVDMLSSKINV